MTIHREGRKIILSVWLIGALLITVNTLFIRNIYCSCTLSAICLFFMLFVLFFFRVPSRKTAPGDNVVTSVADGEVVIIDKVFEPEYFKGECIQISVYMDFFNVHVNFWPIDGELSYYKYHPGRYFLAFLPKASELNEHASVAVKSPYGDVFFKQMAGTFARRIITYSEPGHKVKGTQCGIIKFGSRIDMYLPLDAEIQVKVGDNVTACETVIANFKK